MISLRGRDRSLPALRVITDQHYRSRAFQDQTTRKQCQALQPINSFQQVSSNVAQFEIGSSTEIWTLTGRPL